ncbi:hypothetical protein JL100_032360 (plasmid) [Skermanella mucosa]|uniref:hypothetical protein n=1 Tax=Skermanella mucosa TaxID=1789672 RepID=UPI00192B26C4|nr:hypothetical protein [Skermanella mucosa]UEM24322.1 hypothetical protein JL100_032360 [Skermanella mucosa]
MGHRDRISPRSTSSRGIAARIAPRSSDRSSQVIRRAAAVDSTGLSAGPERRCASAVPTAASSSVRSLSGSSAGGSAGSAATAIRRSCRQASRYPAISIERSTSD